MKRNVLVLMPFDEKVKSRMKEIDPSADFVYETRESVGIDEVKNSNIIIGNPPPEMLREAASLEWLQLESAGVDKYLSCNVLKEKTILTNASGAYDLAISEYILGVMLELYKRLNLYRDNQYKGIWRNEGSMKSIYKSKVLIVGAGSIGSEFARKAKAIGAYTIGVRRRNREKPDYFDEMHLIEELEKLLPSADAVVLSLPSTKSTYKIMDKRKIQLMKKDAVVINVGRGNCIDTDALCDCLESGEIFGAALDVTDPEPLPKDHRIWKIKNAVVTPHVSGGYNLKKTYENILELCIKNFDAFTNGGDMINIINRKKGY